jgi:hypothetical protein
MGSSSSVGRVMVEAMHNTFSNKLNNLMSTHLLNVHLKLNPSHSSATDLFCSFIILYNSQNWIAKLEFPTHTSSQNLTLRPLSSLYLYPIFSTLAAHRTPFQKLEEPLSLQVNKLGLEVLYLKSTSYLQIFSLSTKYLLTQDPNKHRLSSLRLGTPNPPNSFSMVTCCQLTTYYHSTNNWLFEIQSA